MEDPRDSWDGALSKLIDYLKMEQQFKPQYEVNHFGLRYLNKNQHKNRPGIKTILIYRLEFLFRAYTSDWPHGLAPEFPMPSGGRPCRNEIAELVGMTFPDDSENLNTDFIKKCIKQMITNENLEIGWGDWPTDQYQRGE